jgi:hypothetical protein
MVKEIRTITASVGASASVKVTTSFEKDLNVVGVMVTERAGTSLTNVHLTFDIDGVPLIRPSIPASQLGSVRNQAMDLKFTIKQGSSFGVSVTNNLTSAITLDIALLVE